MNILQNGGSNENYIVLASVTCPFLLQEQKKGEEKKHTYQIENLYHQRVYNMDLYGTT